MELLLGANVSINKKGLLAAIEETLEYEANAFMIYTRSNRAPRKAKAMKDFHIEEAILLMRKHGLDIKNGVVHAPYTINLAGNDDVRKSGIQILKEEIERTDALGIPHLVFHPGAHIGQGVEIGIERIAEALNKILSYDQQCIVLLETMAGDGSKVGCTFEEISEIIKRVEVKSRIGVCMDTCHNWSMGYDIVNDFDGVLDAFDEIIGLEKLKVLHVNGSKFEKGARKDRHANIGAEDDTIGKETLRRICHHPKLIHIPKILETPFGQYKEEIAYLRGDDEADLSRVSLK